MAPTLLQQLRAKLANKRANTTASPPSPALPPSPTNKAPHVATAATKVFAITELLEQILLNLDTSSLLLCLRVSHLINTTISSSLLLKASLFLLPSLPSRTSPWPGFVKRNTLLEGRNALRDQTLRATWTSPATGKTYRVKIRHFWPMSRYGCVVTVSASTEYRNSLGVRRPPPPLAREEVMGQEPPSKYLIELMPVPRSRTCPVCTSSRPTSSELAMTTENAPNSAQKSTTTTPTTAEPAMDAITKTMDEASLAEPKQKPLSRLLSLFAITELGEQNHALDGSTSPLHLFE
ncbi:hypothetical protein AC579_9139 [Pseudocercospora musae]|uniref:F-box domain-containing protein n=1 Tax=Pseudocercospora musae TaxID=113226 RepID=A0A139IIK1_9PEZI|nr:hypothetical protein AC579_9139 [Pseudocercospora musae]